MEKSCAVWDFLAAFLGLSCVEWEEDFPSDGYTDLWGRDVLRELFTEEKNSRRSPEIRVLRSSGGRAEKKLG